ncbi:hypothetical protein TCAL_09213 [Tigriopus californicus]|uniref:Uncharacterized protein n=1 Tax=Tigriopus californicus TaxID=6832 RepID=A0A553PGZ3_TIGCA|nr:hypothetical protein TCAL_09213 [Tigriopus californicus]|eukprot:TCALIF_09213-PA protein Name:"Protein of unknown function" AED:0.88 eAED:0.93 QI:11/0/0/0.66/0.5/0.33/3/0/156
MCDGGKSGLLFDIAKFVFIRHTPPIGEKYCDKKGENSPAIFDLTPKGKTNLAEGEKILKKAKKKKKTINSRHSTRVHSSGRDTNNPYPHSKRTKWKDKASQAIITWRFFPGEWNETVSDIRRDRVHFRPDEIVAPCEARLLLPRPRREGISNLLKV